MEQTAIPVPPPGEPSGPCRWCGKPSVGTVEVEKERWRSDRGVRVLARSALLAPACPDHIDILARQEQE